jgi:hypothetical protein
MWWLVWKTRHMNAAGGHFCCELENTVLVLHPVRLGRSSPQRRKKGRVALDLQCCRAGARRHALWQKYCMVFRSRGTRCNLAHTIHSSKRLLSASRDSAVQRGRGSPRLQAIPPARLEAPEGGQKHRNVPHFADNNVASSCCGGFKMRYV